MANLTNVTNVSLTVPPASFGDFGFEPLYDGCLIVLCVLILVINALVMWLFASKRQLRSKTNSLLVSLATSDFLMGLVGVPTYIACNATGAQVTWLCVVSVVMYRLIATSTIYHIFAITVERYISVLHPLEYLTLVTRPRIGRTIASIWVFSLFVALIQLSWTDFSDFGTGLAKEPIRLKLALAYDIFGTLACFLLPTLAMGFIYYRMLAVVRRQSAAIQRLHVTGDSQKPSSAISTAEARAIAIFALMLGIFVCCWVTFYISVFQEYTNYYGAISFGWLNFFDFIRFATAFVNPLLYTFLKQDFRLALRRAFHCCAEGKRNESLSGWRTEETPMVSQVRRDTAF